MVEIFKGELKPEFSNRKVSCKIRDSYVKEGLLILNGDEWFILNDLEAGHGFIGYENYGYKCSYCIAEKRDCNVIVRYPNLNLAFLNELKIYELWG